MNEDPKSRRHSRLFELLQETVLEDAVDVQLRPTKREKAPTTEDFAAVQKMALQSFAARP